MEKFYIVSADVFESNFPEDYEQMLIEGDVFAFETEKTITEVGEVLVTKL